MWRKERLDAGEEVGGSSKCQRIKSCDANGATQIPGGETCHGYGCHCGLADVGQWSGTKITNIGWDDSDEP